ncbi:MAG TPA: ABC transporter substrate-binding protein [Xanthobacteraceae bacterium]|jgi:NitT/TauT family transport system substrate-binding protein|nr:ABC transporter substrate-binding protein [Xanthobacteraceae bacterium]
MAHICWSVRKATIAVALALVSMLAALGGAAAGKLTPVRFGTQVATSNAGLYLADEFGYFKDEGIDLHLIVMTDPPTLITSLATGQLDAAGISVTPGLFAAVDQGILLHVVGDKQSLGNGFSGVRLAARKGFSKGSEAATFAALKGKKIALNTKGAITYYLLEQELLRHGLKLSDVDVVELSQSTMIASLGSGAIDAGLILEPFLSQAIQSNIAEQISDLTKAAPGGYAVVTPVVFGESLVKDRKTGEAFMRAYMRGVRAYNDAFRKDVNKDKVIDILAARTKVDRKIIASSFPPGLDPDQRVTVEAMDAFQKFYVNQNLVRKPIDVRKLIDMSYAQAAVKALGEYK